MYSWVLVLWIVQMASNAFARCLRRNLEQSCSQSESISPRNEIIIGALASWAISTSRPAAGGLTLMTAEKKADTYRLQTKAARRGDCVRLQRKYRHFKYPDNKSAIKHVSRGSRYPVQAIKDVCQLTRHTTWTKMQLPKFSVVARKKQTSTPNEMAVTALVK